MNIRLFNELISTLMITSIFLLCGTKTVIMIIKATELLKSVENIIQIQNKYNT